MSRAEDHVVVDVEIEVVEVEKVIRMLGDISRLTSCKGINFKRSAVKVASCLIDQLEKIDTYCETAEKELLNGK